ncbi:MAG: DUF2076 domain-containing protein [Hyphomicrobiales bacterium]|nr:DUF2076 domain-containing protein [Hyphomicrobiales bacterium]
MTPEECQVITGIFERLKATENRPRDPEAERLISDLVAQQPYAPYAMAQLIYVNEQALANLQQRIETLGQQLQQARDEAQARPQSGGFLSSLFGAPSAPPPSRPAQTPPARPGYGQQPYGGSAPAPAGPMSGVAPQPGGPWGGQPSYGQPPYGQPPYGQQPWGGAPQGGGFLQNAMSTAAGVAGGVVLANALTSAFGHHSGLGLGSGAGTGLGSFGSSGLGDTDAANRQDAFSQDSGGNWNSSDRDRPVDASYDPSQGTSSDEDDDGSGDDSNNFDDSGSSDDSGFSGDV